MSSECFCLIKLNVFCFEHVVVTVDVQLLVFVDELYGFAKNIRSSSDHDNRLQLARRLPVIFVLKLPV